MTSLFVFGLPKLRVIYSLDIPALQYGALGWPTRLEIYKNDLEIYYKNNCNVFQNYLGEIGG
jgi:hypothetical protein